MLALRAKMGLNAASSSFEKSVSRGIRLICRNVYSRLRKETIST
jgi:hypothetical protein